MMPTSLDCVSLQWPRGKKKKLNKLSGLGPDVLRVPICSQ